MSNHLLDAMAERIFTTAIRDHRAGELLECLFEGGSATVDPTGQLILIPASIISQAASPEEIHPNG